MQKVPTPNKPDSNQANFYLQLINLGCLLGTIILLTYHLHYCVCSHWYLAYAYGLTLIMTFIQTGSLKGFNKYLLKKKKRSKASRDKYLHVK